MLHDILFNSKEHNSKLEKLNIVNINKDPRRIKTFKLLINALSYELPRLGTSLQAAPIFRANFPPSGLTHFGIFPVSDDFLRGIMTIGGNGSPIKPLSGQRGGIQTTHLREKCVRDFHRCRGRPFQTFILSRLKDPNRMFLFQLPRALWSFEYLPVLFCFIKEASSRNFPLGIF